MRTYCVLAAVLLLLIAGNAVEAKIANGGPDIPDHVSLDSLAIAEFQRLVGGQILYDETRQVLVRVKSVKVIDTLWFGDYVLSEAEPPDATRSEISEAADSMAQNQYGVDFGVTDVNTYDVPRFRDDNHQWVLGGRRSTSSAGAGGVRCLSSTYMVPSANKGVRGVIRVILEAEFEEVPLKVVHNHYQSDTSTTIHNHYEFVASKWGVMAAIHHLTVDAYAFNTPVIVLTRNLGAVTILVSYGRDFDHNGLEDQVWQVIGLARLWGPFFGYLGVLDARALVPGEAFDLRASGFQAGLALNQSLFRVGSCLFEAYGQVGIARLDTEWMNPVYSRSWETGGTAVLGVSLKFGTMKKGGGDE